ncbi:hypothetical protein [Bacillus inaquosorum]|uniref:hypothetical protein n=1 Tax=Bacillus inaquosorum TaxID=483913 RepID=UPI002281CE1B|nr:hypothetical protein [Bacillus inaquosorum]MCY7757892.1 hypothetical protein [Bacillus inaquosorum]MCY8731448.1 hypothetical protein [Bacillus inaquosorum]
MADFAELYNDPILSKKRIGSVEDPYLTYNETLTIFNGRALLTEIPNREFRVEVTGDNKEWREIEDGELDDNYFKVDYLMGVVFFNASNEGKSLTFNYSGEGASFFPASRIWIKRQGNMVIETLQGLIDEAEDAIIRMNERIAECERVTKRCIEITKWCREATSNYEYVVENTRKIYKPSVYTYADIITTYPNPLIGWTVAVKETKTVYRWDGFDWVDIGTSEVYEGFNILLSAVEPFSANYIWYQDEGLVPEKQRVIISNVAPESGMVWYEID